jgi:hypothetical protein
MNVDLPPSSAFTPDPTVARARTTRDTLTLALAPEQGPVDARRELVSGSIRTERLSFTNDDSFRVVIASVEEIILTVTF